MTNELIRIVDSIHRDKNIDPEVVYAGIESAIQSAMRKHFGEEAQIEVQINRQNGQISTTSDGKLLDAETLGRISAQLAKQIIIQKIREAERDAVYDEFHHEVGVLVHGQIGRPEGNLITVNLGKVEAILPRSEQIPGETYRPGERIKAVIVEVRKAGQRVKIVLSRAHPDFVRRLFEQEVPEISEHVIEIRAIAREAGYRTKVAVNSYDSKVDCVGACVGVRGSRIKNILQELGGERIDIIRYSDSLQVLITNALQPASVEEVQYFSRMGRAIVLVAEDQLSQAIGKRGQNVRLASKLCGVDIEIRTFDELTKEIENAEATFSQLPIEEDQIEALLVEGIFSFDDLSVMEVDVIAEVTGLAEEQAEELIAMAEERAESETAPPSGRAALLSNSPSRQKTSSQVEKMLRADASDTPAKPKPVTAADVFGNIERKSPERTYTADEVFGSTAPTAANLFGSDQDGTTNLPDDSSALDESGVAPEDEELVEHSVFGDDEFEATDDLEERPIDPRALFGDTDEGESVQAEDAELQEIDLRDVITEETAEKEHLSYVADDADSDQSKDLDSVTDIDAAADIDTDTAEMADWIDPASESLDESDAEAIAAESIGPGEPAHFISPDEEAAARVAPTPTLEELANQETDTPDDEANP